MLCSRPVIIISEPRIARYLVDMHSASVSDRPPTYMIDLVTDDKHLTFARYCQFTRVLTQSYLWHSPITCAHDSFSVKLETRSTHASKFAFKRSMCKISAYLASRSYPAHVRPHDQSRGISLICHLPLQLIRMTLRFSQPFFAHTTRFSYSVATAILAGIRSPRTTSPILATFINMIEKWSAIIEPGSQPPVDQFPILKYVPTRWAPWKSLCSEIRAVQFDLYDGFIRMCERRIEQDKRNGSLLESVIEEKKLGIDRALIRCVSQMMSRALLPT
jgi:Cytochrome P450.